MFLETCSTAGVGYAALDSGRVMMRKVSNKRR